MTLFLKAVAKEKISKTLFVNHKQNFTRLYQSYETIFIDDANIDQLEDTQLLSLIDNQVGKTLRVLYDTVFKKKGIVQMIAMNRKEFDKIYYRLRQGKKVTRLLFHSVKKSLYLFLLT